MRLGYYRCPACGGLYGSKWAAAMCEGAGCQKKKGGLGYFVLGLILGLAIVAGYVFYSLDIPEDKGWMHPVNHQCPDGSWVVHPFWCGVKSGEQIDLKDVPAGALPR